MLCMTPYETVDLICSLVSTLSIIISGGIVCHHYLKKLSVRVFYDKQFLSILACPLSHPVTIKKIYIKIGKQLINSNDIFLSNGKQSIDIDLNHTAVIKRIQLNALNANIAKIKIILSDNSTSHHICRIRRT